MKKRFFKFFGATSFLIVMISLLAVCSSASVFTGSCGENLTYIFDTYDNSLTIEGSGDMTDFESRSDVPWNAANHFVQKLYLPEGITSIGDNAFYGTGVTEVVIPENVEKIGKNAFRSSYLKSVKMPVDMGSIGEYAFAFCDIKSITIPYGVTILDKGVLYGCGELVSITMNGSINRVEEYAFYQCEKLESISFTDDLVYLGTECFRYCSSLSSLYVESVGGWLSVETGKWYYHPFGTQLGTFYVGGEVLTDLVIPEGIEKIRGYAFANCKDISTVVLNDDVKEIGSYAFYRCNGLHHIDFSDKITDIGIYAFYACNSLTEIELPEALENINQSAFSYCESLEYVKFESNLKNLGIYAFDSCFALEIIEIPEGVTSIDRYAFIDCESLRSVSLPDSLEFIGKDAFSGTSVEELYVAVLKSWLNVELEYPTSNPLCENGGSINFGDFSSSVITVPEGIENINKFAFYKCNNIEVVIFDKDVKSVSEEAFTDCKNLGMVCFYGRNTNISAGAFYDCNALKKVVLLSAGTVDSYFSDDEYEKIYLYEVLFDANGGENAPDSIVEYKDQTAYISMEIPQKENCDFVGWSAEPDGEVVYCPGDAYTEAEDITLYAKWKSKATMVYLVDGITNGILGSFSVNVFDVVPIPDDVEKYGYYFIGWYIDENYEETLGSHYVVENGNDIYLYARFELIVLNSASITNDIEIIFVGESVELEVNLYPQEALNKNLIWSSSNTDVATVDANGKVTGHAVGTAYITVVPEVGSGGSTCKVNVKEREPDPNEPTVKIGSQRYPEKNKVEIPIYFLNVKNLEIVGLDIAVSYDHTAMKLVDVKCDYGSLKNEKFSDSDGKVSLSFALKDNDLSSFNVCYLVFELLPEAEYRYYDFNILKHEAYGKSGEEISVARSHGGVFVLKSKKADINFDGTIDIQDALLTVQYLSGWNIRGDMGALDCNSDGVVNVKDAVLLIQYLAGWKVTIG